MQTFPSGFTEAASVLCCCDVAVDVQSKSFELISACVKLNKAHHVVGGRLTSNDATRRQFA